MQYALELKNVHYAYHTLEGETYALKDITFSVREGEFIALVGPSGCGKSTLLHLIAGLLTPEKGLIKINGSYHPDNTSGIGYMLQKDELLEWRTIYQNVLLGLEIQHALTARSRALARVLLTQYGLNAFANAKPSELSGGMRQRCVMAIALAADPDILFADEPTTALDVTIQAQILDLLREIQMKLGTATILVSHDLGVVARVADRVAVMYAGKIVEIGTAEEVYYDPRHPYTWGLMRSLPAFANGKESLYTIPGMPPTLIDPPKGDAFAYRNEYALNIDYEEMPPMFKITDTHYAATWLLDPRAPQIKSPMGGTAHE